MASSSGSTGALTTGARSRARHGVKTVFDRAAIPGLTQLRRYGIALLAIIAVTAIGFLQRIFSTVQLSFAQWSTCIGLALSLAVVEELIKVFIRWRARRNVPTAAAPATVAG